MGRVPFIDHGLKCINAPMPCPDDGGVIRRVTER
jgi:hypothetical protein